MCLLVEWERFSSLQFRDLENKHVKTVQSKQNCVCPASWPSGMARTRCSRKGETQTHCSPQINKEEGRSISIDPNSGSKL